MTHALLLEFYQGISLPYVDVGRRNHFGLLQHIIRQHLQVIVDKEWSEYSMYIGRLLKSLVRFNFYGSPERIDDLIDPILSVLDRRNVIRTKKEVPSLAKTQSGIQSSTSLQDVKLEDKTQSDDEAMKLERELELKYPVEKKIYDTLDSTTALCCILLLVAVAMAITIYQVSVPGNDSPGSPLWNWSTAISGVFIIEVGIRMYCYWRIKGNLMSFFGDKFNLLDIGVCLIDVVFIALPSSDEENGSDTKGGSLVKVARMARLLRLTKILRAAKLVHKITNEEQDVETAYADPIRFSRFEQHEISTMIEFVKVLSYIQSLIEDRSVSIFLKHFHRYHLIVILCCSCISLLTTFYKEVWNNQLYSLPSFPTTITAINIITHSHS